MRRFYLQSYSLQLSQELNLKARRFDIDFSITVIWWLLAEIAGLVVLPFVASVCSELKDSGYTISKIFGMLLLTYLTWLVSALHLSAFTSITTFYVLLMISAPALYLIVSGTFKPRLNLKMIVKHELVFAVAFLSMCYILSIRPDISAEHSEDFMNFAMLQSIMRSDYFPPMDPWFAGETMNYYFLGQLNVALLTKLSGISSTITYNLSMAMFFALAASAAYGIGYNLTGKSFYGLITILLTLISGFAIGFEKLMASLSQAGFNLVDWFTHYKFWEDAGLIPVSTIFYPFYSFIHGYLHAHMMSIPFQLMFILLLYNFVKKSERKTEDLLLIALCLGYFSAINLWEYPTYLILSAMTIIIFLPRKEQARALAGIALLSTVLFMPYYLMRNAGGFNGLGIALHKTPLLNFVEVFGALILIILPFLLFSDNLFYLVEQMKKHRIKAALICVALVMLTLLLNFEILIILALTALLCCVSISISSERETKFISLLILTGALLSLFCDTIYVSDAFGYPYERFNTVMKVYLQIWVLWGVSASFVIFKVTGNANKKLKGNIKAKSIIWRIFAVLIIMISLVHPVAMTASWSSGNFGFWESYSRQTLDGSAYLIEKNFEDYKAINWINHNIKNQPNMIEAPGKSYTYSSRISTFTGLPALIGWESHEVIWGRDYPEISQRISDTNTIYNTAELEIAIKLLDKYHIEYIYIGSVEKEKYNQKGMDKFGEKTNIFYKVYESDGAVIYRFTKNDDSHRISH